MDVRRNFKIVTIKARIESCEAERLQILKMVTKFQVNLAWASDRMDIIQRTLRFHYRVEKLQSEE